MPGSGTPQNWAPEPGAQGQGGGPPQQWGAAPAGMGSVYLAETRVTGARVVQYIIDYILAGIIPALAYWGLNRGSGVLHALGWVLATVIALAVYFWYWVARPYGHNGKTFGMQLLGLRVISKDGSRASMMQLFIRGILLIIDTIFFGLVGFITMLCSRYRQRVGDHAAKTIVISAGHGVND
jgi:uncharacterized RDD family membrane protein YckC